MDRLAKSFLLPWRCLCVAVLCLLSSGELHATHKAWLLKNSGAQCVLQYPRGNDAYPGIIENTEPFGVYVSCSVTLAGRGGSSDNGNPAPTWLRAKQARIFVEDVRSPFWCRARAEDVFGNVYYSAGKWSPGHGFRIIDLIDDERDWGGSLELEEDGFFRQLDFECRLGSRRSASAPAKLFGYDIAICQNRSTDRCTTVSINGPEGRSTVQGNGIECAASTADGGRLLRRSVLGITNEGEEEYSVHCPITQPADDSYEHSRKIYSMEVAYTGRMPGCRIESFDERGNLRRSPTLVPDTLWPNTLALPDAFETGTEKSLALRCELPPRSTIEGYVSSLSVTRKSGGT